MAVAAPERAVESTAFYAHRRMLVDSDVVRVETVWSDAVAHHLECEIHSPVRQLVFPIAGAFAMRVGSRETVCDANQVVLVPPGLIARDRLLGKEAPRALILSLRDAHLEELLAPFGRRAEWSRSFERLTQRASPRVQRMAALLSRQLGRDDSLAHEETVLDLIRAAFGGDADHAKVGAGSHRLVVRIKELLAQSGERLSLDAIGRALDASPIYLTDLFRRVEGIPISRYQRQLRLAKALTLLPDAADLTGLALELGFSSHSHFATAFKAMHGITPSAHRGSFRTAP